MADPLSVSAGIAGLLAIAGTTVSTCYSYGCLLKDGPAEVQRLVEEMMSIAGVLTAVKAMVDRTVNSALQDTQSDAAALDAPPPPYSPIEARDHFQQLSEPIQKTERALQDVQKALREADVYQEQNKLGRIVKRLRWPLKREHTLDVVGRLERYKGLFILCLDTANLSMTVDVQRTLEDVRQGQILDRLERRTKEQMTELRQSFQWLCPVDFAEAHRDARRLHLHGTGSWILKLPEWQSWLQKDRAFLWLYGIPGSGKTVMTSTLIEDCLNASMNEKNYGHIAYFYCDFRNKESQRPEVILGGFIAQLCAQITKPVPEFDQFVKSHRSHGGVLSKPTCEELKQLLYVALDQTDCAIIMLDALDECVDRSVILELLTALPSYKGSNVKVLVSSRQEGDIDAALAPFGRLSTRVDAQKADIEFYVSCAMANSPRLCRLKPELRCLVKDTLVDSAQGMFRWVQCQIDSLSRLHTDRDIRRAVNQLPPTLNDTYERILARIDELDRTTARRALIWLACAPRQLSISELTEAVAIDEDTTLRDAEAVWDPADLLSVIGSLARYSPTTQRIELAHHSVKDFLATAALKEPLTEFHLDASAGRIELAARMLQYLLMEDFAKPCANKYAFTKRLESYPLFYFAARYWPFFAREALLAGNKDIFALSTRLLTATPNGNFWSWMDVLVAQGPASFRYLEQRGYDRTARADPSSRMHWRPPPKNLQPLYYAASFGLTPIVAHLIQQGADVSAHGGRFFGTALHAAIFRNHADVAAVLIDAGARVSVRDIHGDTPRSLGRLVGKRDAALSVLPKAWGLNNGKDQERDGEAEEDDGNFVDKIHAAWWDGNDSTNKDDNEASGEKSHSHTLEIGLD